MSKTTELYLWLILAAVQSIIMFVYWRLSKKASSTRARRFTNVRKQGGSAFTFDPNKKSVTIHEPGTYHVEIVVEPKEKK